MIKRQSCCVCNKTIEEFYSLPNFPVSLSYIDDNEKEDFFDLTFAKCVECGTVQLSNLIEPALLYSKSHNNTFETPSWKEHHQQFASFIQKNTSATSLIEYGGYSGCLARLLNKQDYTIVDLCDKDPAIPNVKFVNANCETWDALPKESTILMSHLFEHLYNPRTLLENCKKAGVDSFFISIPNMDYALDTNNISFIHLEHTYFINDSIIRWLFSQYGYTCKASYSFKNHSLFYHFVQGVSDVHVAPNTRTEEVVQYLHNRELRFSKTELVHPTYLVPSGHFGQMLHYFMSMSSRENVIGFLDNDKEKQGKKLYGTGVYTFSPLILKDIDSPGVLLIDTPYRDELHAQLNSINPNIEWNLV